MYNLVTYITSTILKKNIAYLERNTIAQKLPAFHKFTPIPNIKNVHDFRFHGRSQPKIDMLITLQHSCNIQISKVALIFPSSVFFLQIF